MPKDVDMDLDVDVDKAAEACASLFDAWAEVGRGGARVPAATTPAGRDLRQFSEFKPDGPPNLAYAAGQSAGIYVNAIGRHVLALEALIRARQVAVAPWPLVRASLELAGRVAWLLEPDLGDRSGERRAARFYLETISSFQRERYTSGKHDKRQARQAKTARDANVAEASSVFGEIELDFAIDKIETWVIHGEPSKDSVQELSCSSTSASPRPTACTTSCPTTPTPR